MSKILPKYNNTKNVGNIAADILKSVLQKFAIVNPHDESIDLGIDMRAQIIKNNSPTEYFFNIQSKGTDILNSEEEYFTRQIQVSTVNYWLQQNDTTFLFLVDINTQNCYWVNPISDLLEKIEDIQKNQTVTIRIPRENCLNYTTNELPEEFIQNIIQYTVSQIEKGNIVLEQLKSSIQASTPLDMNFSIEILKSILLKAQKLNTNIDEIVNALIEDIKQNLEGSISYFNQLIFSLSAKNYVTDFYNDTGFSAKGKSYNDLKKEFEEVMKNIHDNSPNINIHIIDNLKETYIETLRFQYDVLAFLYEMQMEDAPYNDFSEIKSEMDILWIKIKKAK